MPYKPPYTLITGAGLGTCYSSLTQIGAIRASNSVGAAGLQLYANAHTGNLIVRDHVITIMEQNGPLEFSYIYNSQASSPETLWRLAVGSRLIVIPSTERPLGPEVVLLESDGHETHYTPRPEAPLFYFAPGHREGTPYLTYRYSEGHWERYDPGTRMTYYYDPQGLLRQHFDPLGRTTRYEYENNALSAVVGPSGCRYEIHGQGTNCRSLYQIEPGQTAVLLQQYLFDPTGRLVKSVTPTLKDKLNKDYETIYHYVGYFPLLCSIEQTDTQLLTFTFDTHYPQRRIYEIVSGTEQANGTTFDYAGTYNPHITIKESNMGNITLTLDDQGRFSRIDEECFPGNMEISEPCVDVTSYTYAKTGQVSTITSPDGSIERFFHDNFFGLSTRHEEANGRVTEYNYDTEDTPSCTSQVSYLKAADGTLTPLVTRFVYDRDFDHTNSNHLALRFVINPANHVTEHRIDAQGQVISTRCYLNATFISPAVAPILLELTDWVAEQNPQAVSLSEFTYDSRGQQRRIKQYAAIDAAGNGIDNATASEEHFYRNAAGNCYRHTVRLDAEQLAVSTFDYDELERVISETDVLGDTINHSYSGPNDTLTRTLQNSDTRQTRVETTLRNNQGLTQSLQQTVSEENLRNNTTSTTTRLTKYEYEQGNQVLTTLPDNRPCWHYWDYKRRPILAISPTGLTTLNIYDRTGRYQTTLRPKQPMVMSSEDTPTTWEAYYLAYQLCLSEGTRSSYLFYDETEHERYRIDAENYISESHYDLLHRVTATIRYADKVTDAELTILKNKQPLPQVIDPTRDRWHSYYFDLDNNVIGEIDPAGWVTETLRDSGGRALKITRYATPTHAPAVTTLR